MTSEEAIKEIKDASDSEVRYGDKDNHYDKVMKRVEAFEMAIKALKQQPKVGKWIDTGIGKEELYGEMFVCSECNSMSYYENYCPNCGADMREGEK